MPARRSPGSAGPDPGLGGAQRSEGGPDGASARSGDHSAGPSGLSPADPHLLGNPEYQARRCQEPPTSYCRLPYDSGHFCNGFYRHQAAVLHHSLRRSLGCKPKQCLCRDSPGAIDFLLKLRLGGKIRGTFFWAPIIRIRVCWGLYWGPPYF